MGFSQLLILLGSLLQISSILCASCKNFHHHPQADHGSKPTKEAPCRTQTVHTVSQITLCPLGMLLLCAHPQRPLLESCPSVLLQNNFIHPPGNLWVSTSLVGTMQNSTVCAVPKSPFCFLGKLWVCSHQEDPLWTPRSFFCF